MRRGDRSERARNTGLSAAALAKADGAALLATLMAMTLMTVLASTLILATLTEAAIAATYRDGLVTRYVAEGAVERAIDTARAAMDWRLLATRSVQWAFAERSGSATVRATAAALDAGVETLELTVDASGPGGAARTLVVVVARESPLVSSQIRVISWRENP